MRDSVSCPYLTVDISSPFIRRCFRSKYVVSYCNQGTSDASQAFVEVLLDTSLTYDTSHVALSSQVGNLLRFDLGTVAVGECGSFDIFFTENCNSVFGQAHCTSVHIYPDSLCFGRDCPKTPF